MIEQSSKVGIKIIELPLLGKNSIRNKQNQKDLITNIRDILDYTYSKNVKIVFELDLPPADFLNFIHEINHPVVGINYDMGNSAMFGFDPEEEISLFGKYICNVHIKDGVKNGGTVKLGTGDTDFDKVFSTLEYVNYNGDLIFQAARLDLSDYDIQVSPQDTIKKYISFIKSLRKCR